MRILHADSIRKTYHGRTVLNDIFISSDQGEILGLLGRNGSGKSTLLKVIFGSLGAKNKFVSVNGKKVDSLYATKNLIRYLPQNHFLPNHKKIKDLIYCFCTKVDELKKHDFIKHSLDKKIHQLSGGERRIVEILLLVYSDAKVVLLDEPFNGIAPNNIDVIKDIIKSCSKDISFIITDHDYQNVIDVSTRLLLIQDGNTKRIEEVTDLFKLGYLPKSAALF